MPLIKAASIVKKNVIFLFFAFFKVDIYTRGIFAISTINAPKSSAGAREHGNSRVINVLSTDALLDLTWQILRTKTKFKNQY